MSTITTISSGALITASRTTINNNFSALNTDKMETSVLDTDTTLAANSDAKVATQKAVKAYVDAGGNVNASTSAKGIVEEADSTETNAGTAVGATGARLFVNPSNLNAYTVAYHVTKCGDTTRDLSTASGAQTIAHGLGRVPSRVHIRGTYAEGSAATSAQVSIAETIYNGTTQSSNSVWHLSGNAANGNTGLFVNTFTLYAGGPTNTQTGVVTVDATNITITWTKANSPTGTAKLLWEVQ